VLNFCRSILLDPLGSNGQHQLAVLTYPRLQCLQVLIVNDHNQDNLPHGPDKPRDGASPDEPRANPQSRRASASEADTNGARKRRPRKLLPRQAAFARLISDPASPAYGNRPKATAMAGYAPGKPGSNQLSVQAHRLANNPRVQRLMSEILDEQGGTLDHCAARLVEASNATRRKVLRGTNDRVIYSDSEPDHPIRLQAIDRITAFHREARHSTGATPNSQRGVGVTATTPEEQRRLAAAQDAVEQLPSSERMSLRTAFALTREITRKVAKAQTEPSEQETPHDEEQDS
jgi:hypothetical protein